MKERTGNSAGFKFHYPTAPVIVTAKHGLKENAMTAAWHAPLSHEPSLYAIMLSQKRFTCQLILESKEFGVNFMPLDKAEFLAKVGGTKGAEIDKFDKFKIAREKAIRTSVPIIKDAYASYECRLIDHRPYGDHELLVGEVVAVHYEKEAFTDKGLNAAKARPVVYLGGDNYTTINPETKSYDRQTYAK